MATSSKKPKEKAFLFQRHPWDEWFSRKGEFTLKQGQDFAGETWNMSIQIRNRARAHGLRAIISLDTNSLTIRFVPRPKKTGKK